VCMICMCRGDRVQEGAIRHASDGNMVQLRTRDEVMHEGCSDSESASNSDNDGEGLHGLDQEWKQKIT